MKKIKILIPLFLGIFLCWYAYSQFTENQLLTIKEHFLKADYFLIFLSVFMGFLADISRALRWQLLLSPMGYRAKTINRIMAVFIGYLVNVTIPRSGEVSRALVINRYDGVPFDKSFGTIISERVVDMILMLTISFSVICIQFDLIKDFLFSKISFGKFLPILVFLFLFGILFLWWIFKSKSALATKISSFLLGLKEGVLSIFRLKNRKLFFLHTLFIWAMYFLMFYVPFFALEETATASFSTILTAFVVGSFAIAFTNGGIGSYPFFIAEILYLFGIQLVTGTALGWIIWISQFFMTLLFGGLSFLLLPILNKK